MLNQLYELFLCPVDGLFSPRNWPLILTTWSIVKQNIWRVFP